MKYCLVIPKKVQKEIGRIDKKYKGKILLALKILEEEPYTGKKLEGEYKGKWSYRVWPYRIIYEIHKNELIILIIHIGHRQSAY
ncbi:MAG: type II toxin-antitoxin system mRNA interferase toxin, RelE/StbE family [Candidatus Saganbacteria bacterium]|nr:type II toxin-antitoxin system mRNA interferase toxin, RelE/StbE family [Candidatus Saganbacteria bacterium]